MKTLYENQFLKITLEDQAPIIIFTWLFDSRIMSEEVYKEEMHKVADFQITYKTHKPLVDIREFHFVITPPLQEWVDQNILGKFIQSGLSKVAYVASNDVFAQIAVEQTMEETNGSVFKVQYFKEYEKARNWLMGIE